MKDNTVKLRPYNKLRGAITPSKPWSAKKCTIESLKSCLINSANAFEAIGEKKYSEGIWRVIKKINKFKE